MSSCKKEMLVVKWWEAFFSKPWGIINEVVSFHYLVLYNFTYAALNIQRNN